MASKTLIELTSDTPGATDLLYFVKNPGGSPLDRAVTLANLGTALGTSLTQHQIGFGSASNLVTGDAGFTFGSLAGGVLDVGGNHAFEVDPTNATTHNILLNMYPTLNGDYLEAIDAGFTLNATGNGTAGTSVYAGPLTINALGFNIGTVRGVVPAITLNGTGSESVNAVIGFDIDSLTTNNFASVATKIGINIPDISGATDNLSIKTGTGDIVFGALAGTGSRPVVADANGKLSAL